MGFILAGLGVTFTGVSYGWNFFGFRLAGGSSIYTFVQIQIVLNLVEYLGFELGLFFIFLGVLRLLPRVLPWSRVGPIPIPIGAVVVAGMELAEASLLVPFGAVNLSGWIAYGLGATLIAGYVVTTLGVLVSLFAVAKGVLRRGARGARPPGTLTGASLPLSGVSSKGV